MNKKMMIGLAAVLVLLMILGIALGAGEQSDAEPTTEATVETTEEVISGVANNAFDEYEEYTESPVHGASTKETKPAVTIPADSSHIHGAGSSSGSSDDSSDGRIEEPETPKDNNKPQTKPTEATDPTQPTEEVPEATLDTQPVPQEKELSEYEKFQNMSPEDQQTFMESFPDIEDFFEWYDKVKAEHEAANPVHSIGNGKINLEDYE